MCKGCCTCFPFCNFVVSFHEEGIGIAEPLYVSFNPPIFELSGSPCKVVVHRGRPQKDGLKPQQEWFDRLSCGHWLSIYFENMGGRSWAIFIAEPSDSSLVKELDPLDGVVQSKTNIDLEPRVASIDFVPLGALLEGFFVFFELFLKTFDAFGSHCSLVVVVVFSGPDHDTQ